MSTSGARNILLVEWFLASRRSRSGHLRTPDDGHFWCQKYFAGRMVSNQAQFAVRRSQDPESLALLVLEIFRCSISLSIGGEPHRC